MSEVTTWNATDNANTAAPPDGWPEGQQPSSVNDCGRMMMGALRREHDRITAQIGSVAGTISTTTINATTVNTTGAITASGPITGTAINSSGNGSIAGQLTAATLVATGNIFASSGTVTAAQLTSTGNINAAGSVTAAYLNSTGDGNITGLLNTGSLGVFGNAQVNGNINAGAQISGNTVVANGISSNGNMQAAGQFSCGSFYAAGNYGIGNWKFYVTDEIWCARHILPSADGGVGSGDAAWAWAWVESYAYYTKSDPSLKRDIEPVPPGCLDLVNTIEPKTYKLDLEADSGKTHWGFLAPEVGEVMQRAGLKFDGVRTEGDAPSSLAYNEMIPILWAALRELAQEVADLKREKANV